MYPQNYLWNPQNFGIELSTMTAVEIASNTMPFIIQKKTISEVVEKIRKLERIYQLELAYP